MSKGKWKDKMGCKLCSGTGEIENRSYPNVLWAGCVPMFSKVCPRCKGYPIKEKQK